METLQKCGRKAKRNLAKIVCWPNVPHALIGQMSVGQVSVDQMSVGQVSVGQMGVGQMSRIRPLYIRCILT